jgi:hypothetical protein
VHAPTIALVLALALPTRLSASIEPGAESPGERAARHFAAEEWDEAIEALVEAYAQDPDPDYLYARAQAERFRGRCDVAIALYEHFLASEPSPQQRVDTERNIALCKTRLAPTPPPRVEADPQPPAPVDAPPPAAPRKPDAAAIVLVSLGAVAVAAGASLWIVGARTRDRAPRAADEQSYEQTARRGRALTVAGITLTSVGVATTIGGAIRFGVVARDRERSKRRVAVHSK